MRKIKFSHEYEGVRRGRGWGKVGTELFASHELKRLFIKKFSSALGRGAKSLLYHLIFEIYAIRSCYVYLESGKHKNAPKSEDIVWLFKLSTKLDWEIICRQSEHEVKFRRTFQSVSDLIKLFFLLYRLIYSIYAVWSCRVCLRKT